MTDDAKEKFNQAQRDLWNYGFSEPLIDPHFHEQCDPEEVKKDIESWLRRHGIEDDLLLFSTYYQLLQARKYSGFITEEEFQTKVQDFLGSL